MNSFDILRYILKAIVALGWVIVLPVCYVRTFGAPIELLTTIENWFGKPESPLLYITAILVFLAPDVLGIGLLFFPASRRKIEQNDHVVIKVLLWWAQVKVFYV
jgi:callose synthase